MKKLLKLLMTGMVIVIILTGALATAALADNPTATGYSNVQLWVDPEYDDPSLLVMMQGTITGATAPVTVQFLVPTTAVLYSAGSIGSDGQYTGGPPDRTASQVSGWDLISYTATSNTFRVEYYDDIIQGQPDKTINYEFMTYLPITGMNVSVQQPLKATNFTVDPAGNSSTDTQGFNIQTYSYDTVDPLGTLTFDISYYKADNTPSITQNASAGTAAGDATGGGGGLSNGWLAAIIVVVVVAGVGVVYYLTRRSRPASRADRRRYAMPRRASGSGARASGGGGSAKAVSPARTANASTGGGKFCTNCGAPFDANARFCRECGTPRR